jgi:two-component system, NarL family, sensor histidine kinase UhpB
MKLHCFILVILLCIFNEHYIYSQTKKIDSLKLLLVTAAEDTNKVKNLDALSWNFFITGRYKNALQYSEEALMLAEKIGYKKGKADASLTIGYSYASLFKFSESLKYLYSALKSFEESGDKDKAAQSLQLIGKIAFDTGDTTSAISHYFQALKIRKDIGQKWAIVQTYNGIGEVYRKQRKYNEALQQHFAALEILNKAGSDESGWGLPFTYESIGNVYQEQGNAAYATGNKKIAAIKYEDALKKYLTSLTLWKKIDRPDAIPYMYVPIGDMYARLNNIVLAKDYLSKALQMGLKLEDKEVIRNAYLGLSILDSIKGNYEQAYKNHKLYILYRDSIVNEETVKKTEAYKAQYEFEKKDNQIKLLSAENKLKTVQAQKESQQKKLTYAVIGVLLLLGAYGFYRYTRKKRLQSKQAMVNERLRISSDLHDEVGATLSGISMYSHLIKGQLKSNNESGVENSLQVMQQSSSQMVEKLNDIVWFINPEKDSLQQLISKLEDYAIKMAAVKDIKVNIKVPDEISNSFMHTETRRNIYLFCKEAINNAVKYSNATALDFSVTQANDLLQITVADNGVGFDVLQSSNGNGLANMQKRATAVNGQMQLHSGKGAGTSIKLSIKITQ